MDAARYMIRSIIVLNGRHSVSGPQGLCLPCNLHYTAYNHHYVIVRRILRGKTGWKDCNRYWWWLGYRT